MYKCTITWGNGPTDGGLCDIKKTEKRIVFTLVEGEAFYDKTYTYTFPRKTVKGWRCCQHEVIEWGDDNYTLYPDRNGTPFYFEPYV